MGSTSKSDISVVLSHVPAKQDTGAAKADLAWREEVAVVQLIISRTDGYSTVYVSHDQSRPCSTFFWLVY